VSKTRWLPMTGAENVRDLGGLPLVGGGYTKSGVLFRGDTLQELTAGDVALLRSFGLRTVIDLRTPTEADNEGRGLLASEPIEYANLPFMADELMAPGRDQARDLMVAERRESDRVDHYLNYLRYAGDRVVDAVRIMASPDGLPAVFHCAAGKDRTGVLAALVLDAVGVERDAIIADFVLTNERLERIGGRLRRMATYANYTGKLTLGDMSADPVTMSDVLATLDREDNGSAGWLLAHGLRQGELESLRAALRG
jgi:protein-tyrosine phosphatase